MVAERWFLFLIRLSRRAVVAFAFFTWMHDDSLSEASVFGEQPDTAGALGATNGAHGAMLLGSRGFTKPPRFDGRQEQWAAWAFRVESVASLCGWYDYMDQARHAVATINSTSCVGDATEVAKSLYQFLVQTVDGRALQLIRLVQRGDGLEAWRVLCREYQSEAVAVVSRLPRKPDLVG